VLKHLNIIVIHPKYILKRRTKHPQSGCVLDNKEQVIKEDPKLVVSNRFKNLCRLAVEISSKVAESGDASTFFTSKMMEYGIEVDSMLNKRSSTASIDLCYVNSKTNDVRIDETK
jgi:hypothetical protein